MVKKCFDVDNRYQLVDQTNIFVLCFETVGCLIPLRYALKQPTLVAAGLVVNFALFLFVLRCVSYSLVEIAIAPRP